VGQFKDVNGTTTGYASYGNQELAEYIGVSTLAFTRLCIYGPGLDEPVARDSRPPPLLQRIASNFRKNRTWHQNAVWTWDGASLHLSVENDFDKNGLATSDEFSDEITACVRDGFDGELVIVSVETLSQHVQALRESTNKSWIARSQCHGGAPALRPPSAVLITLKDSDCGVVVRK